MNYATVASGIDAPAVAWNPMGWNQLWSSENAKFPCALLAHHYPDIPNLGDMNYIHEREDFKRPDLIMAGTPCQSFSIAGFRKGLADPRGNLTLVFLSIVDRLRTTWVVWENVNGVRNANSGRDFGAILGALGQLGYGWAYRVLDAQYFGVPQRRRRIFVVGYLGDWRRAAAVLFERHCLSGDFKPSKKARAKAATGSVSRSVGRVGGEDDPGAQKETPLIVNARQDPILSEVAQPLDQKGNSQAVAYQVHSQNSNAMLGDGDALAAFETDISRALDTTPGFTASQGGIVVGSLQSGPKGHGHSMTTDQAARAGHLIAYGGGQSESIKVAPSLLSRGNRYDFDTDTFAVNAFRAAGQENFVPGEMAPPICSTDGGGAGPPTIQLGATVRRLLPIECERLMGLPDNYTYIPYGRKGKMVKDCPRYKALGNSIVREQLIWLGQRIEAVEGII